MSGVDEQSWRAHIFGLEIGKARRRFGRYCLRSVSEQNLLLHVEATHGERDSDGATEADHPSVEFDVDLFDLYC